MELWLLWRMEDTIIFQITEQKKNVQINTCKRPPESESMRGKGKALSEEELNHLCFSCKYSFYGWISGFWRFFPASIIHSMTLWAKEVWMLTTRWCKSTESPYLPTRDLNPFGHKKCMRISTKPRKMWLFLLEKKAARIGKHFQNWTAGMKC